MFWQAVENYCGGPFVALSRSLCFVRLASGHPALQFAISAEMGSGIIAKTPHSGSKV
jgi:hypothetical protein